MPITKATQNVIAPILATGTTTPRTLQDRFADVVNVKDFGAVGDGVADDTDKIQAAINASSSVYFPSASSGTIYRTTNPINILGNRTIVGDNSWLSIIRSDNLSAPIFQASNSGNIQIENINLRYNGTPLSGANAISLDNCQTCRLQNLWISSSWNGIFLLNGGNIQISNLWCYVYEQCGLVVTNTIGVLLSQFLFEAGDSIKGTLGGIRIVGAVEQFIATDGGVQRGVYGLTTGKLGVFQRGSAPFYNRFTNVFFDSNKTAGALLRDTAFTDFTACWFSSAGYDSAGGGYVSMLDRSGVDISSCTDLTFTGGEAHANGGRGVLVYPDATRIRFGEMRFYQNQRSRSIDGAAVEFLANTSDFSASSCTFYRDPDTVTYRQLYAVKVNTGSSDKYIITNNLLGGCSITDGGSGTNKFVANNF
jgi:hypothetical protein